MTWNGTLSHTVTGRKCQEWAKDVPHKHRYHIDNRYPEGSEVEAKSFCRDPDGDGAPWCYTIDPDKRWEYCGIPSCTSRLNSLHYITLNHCYTRYYMYYTPLHFYNIIQQRSNLQHVFQSK